MTIKTSIESLTRTYVLCLATRRIHPTDEEQSGVSAETHLSSSVGPLTTVYTSQGSVEAATVLEMSTRTSGHAHTTSNLSRSVGYASGITDSESEQRLEHSQV